MSGYVDRIKEKVTEYKDSVSHWLWDESDNEPLKNFKNGSFKTIVFEEEVKEEEVLPKFKIDAKADERICETKDGVQIKYRIIKGKTKKVMLLASPLGFKDLYVFRPLIAHFGEEYTYINWNYRGLFESDMPKRARKISIRDHAEDALHVLQDAGYDHADVMVGHSMGVQVSLEFTLLHPERVNSLILVNGSHGHVFHTAFQPLIRLPFVGNISEWIIRTLLRNDPKQIFEIVKKILTIKPIDRTLTAIGRVGGSKMMNEINGDWYINEWIHMYFGGLVQDNKSAANYCRLFQELNAHSVYHLLDTIEHPTLLISGGLDYLTPSYHFREIAREMKNATHKCCFFSTHLTLMEDPEFVINHASEFLHKTEGAAVRYERCDSVHFQQTLLIENKQEDEEKE